MDDWQEAAFSNRHMHNRTGCGSKSKHSPIFDVRKTFASYSVKCPSWLKALDGSQNDNSASLELYRLTENGEGVVGELFLPGLLHASVILAGSRTSLRGIIASFEANGEEADAVEEDDEEESDAEPESPEKTRFDTFEKNSFRSPKFWFRWSGSPTSSTGPKESPSVESELGYIVFSGNDCRKFKGTINCASLGWKNVAISGQKLVSRSDSDARVTWGEAEVGI
ncbi:hypothetical protein PtrSN002B_007804 [Pyrenophora tritici-repentis]|uniref:Uncharacterized protein n=2 Tax=Pyrenophora tritici-repentis TaxID=45151 RepID=A0A2W1G4U2_9PLEO|nr:catalase [Pyrenophora tritici-repentis Pt-1C-BFP]KAA8615824.1 hypothetical protein PtrV1_11220 [Pyrenophora tritici-repentis]EDU51161.1 catalase [Pyrenophora tritici-repentis Pt-1C-BFP]KAF7443583.1 hypothetical protein A1F99_116570 [Pyrenophora tritici-repentis]KAF7566702.1 hypothetical protein PtrM4_150220 [Pyrenophora tritici-repentis]KAG9379323.1 hypothetical protein A1F94_009679 [Pyrenophora tritici-repentis]